MIYTDDFDGNDKGNESKALLDISPSENATEFSENISDYKFLPEELKLNIMSFHSLNEIGKNQLINKEHQKLSLTLIKLALKDYSVIPPELKRHTMSFLDPKSILENRLINKEHNRVNRSLFKFEKNGIEIPADDFFNQKVQSRFQHQQASAELQKHTRRQNCIKVATNTSVALGVMSIPGSMVGGGALATNCFATSFSLLACAGMIGGCVVGSGALIGSLILCATVDHLLDVDSKVDDSKKAKDDSAQASAALTMRMR